MLQSTSKPSSLVFIDSTVEDYHSLINGLRPGVTPILLDQGQDGIKQITQILDQPGDIRSIHIVSHGAPGCLFLGNGELSLDTLSHYAAQLQSWFTNHHDSALLLYGCNVAAGDAGAEFVERLHQLTGADIAASRSLTGSAALGGNWELEVTTGTVAAPAFTEAAQQSYTGVLATATFGPDGPSELVGSPTGYPNNVGSYSNVPSPGPGFATWFTNNYLGNTGGPTGNAVTSPAPGFGFSLQGNYGHGNAVHGGNLLFVNGQPYSVPDNGNNSINVTAAAIYGTVAQSFDSQGNLQDIILKPTLSTQLSGLNVSMQYVIGSKQPLEATYATFTNPTAKDITVPVSFATNLAYGQGNVFLKNDQSGDKAFSTDDAWVVFDDNNDSYGGAAIAELFYGPGTPVTKTSSVSQTVFTAKGYSATDVPDNEGILANYTVTIPANSTRSLLFFTANTGSTNTGTTNGVSNDTATANITAAYSTDPSTNTLFQSLNLTSVQKAQLLNWDFGYGINATPVGSPTTTGLGGTASFQIKLKSQPTANVTLNLASSDPTEGVISSGSALTFTSANWNQAQTVTVKGVNNPTFAGTSVPYKILTSFTSADLNYANNSPASLSLTNLNSITPVPAPVPTPAPTPVPTPAPVPVVMPIPIPSPAPKQPIVTSNPLSPEGQLIVSRKKKDVLTGTDGNDQIYGLGGNTKIYGLGGDDLLVGGKGNNRIYAGDGNNTIVGGPGRNVLFGGAGSDLFVLNRKGTEIIRNFNSFDRLGLTGKLRYRDLDIFRDGRDTVIEAGGDTLAILRGVKRNQISRTDFIRY